MCLKIKQVRHVDLNDFVRQAVELEALLLQDSKEATMNVFEYYKSMRHFTK